MMLRSALVVYGCCRAAELGVAGMRHGGGAGETVSEAAAGAHVELDMESQRGDAGRGASAASATGGRVAWSVDMLDAALGRYTDDLLAMQYVRRTFRETSNDTEVAVAPGKKKKVAYMVMVRDGVDQHALWEAWFAQAEPGTFSIYIHQYLPSTPLAASQREAWGPLGASFIPTVKTGWGQLAGVEYALLWEALRDPANAQFVLISEGHVPLKSPGYVYDYLMADDRESKVCFNVPQKSLQLKATELFGTCFHRDTLKYIHFDTKVRISTDWATTGSGVLSLQGRVRKHHQWVVLARRHAVDVINHGEAALHQHFRATYRAPYENGVDPVLLGASDESFVATALLLASEARGAAGKDEDLELRAGGVASSCTTFVYWRNCWKGTALAADAGWGSTRAGDYAAIASEMAKTPMSEWSNARHSPVKVLNDTPRNFGEKGSQPDDRYLEAMVAAGFLFARKFGLDGEGRLSMDLAARLPPLWKAWEEGFGNRTRQAMHREGRMWPTLDVGDPQVASAAAKRVPPVVSPGRTPDFADAFGGLPL